MQGDSAQNPPDTPLLQVEGVSKSFPIFSGILHRATGETSAVQEVSFTLNPNEVLGIVGESGSGKSTLARAALGLIEPTKGTIKYRGEEICHFTKEKMAHFRTRTQFIFQNPYTSLNPRRTVGESIGEALLYHGLVRDEEVQRERVYCALEEVGLPPESIDRYPHQFSGGQQQRICIARAIITRPELIVCDEVISALDLSIQAQILNLLLRLKERHKLSYLFISHDLGVVRLISNRVLVMKNGKIVECGETEMVFQNPKEPYTQRLISSTPIRHPQQRRNGPDSPLNRHPEMSMV